ncbi:DUF1707 SHOCT-like domain-containing protein [Plantactinospora sp. WMMB334]|uniref:DUF1707 SHOCT-like domain-containing protein n=1 Tax=Plantactinospora sp. WMMB334 TaxID=3404119 RepID=UPI003B966E5B
MDGQLRASDSDRQRVVADLQRHTEQGRLSLDEFSERVGAVYSARTLGELAVVTRDLPAVSAPRPGGSADGGVGGAGGTGGGDSGSTGGRRELLVVFAVAVVTLLLLGVFMSVTR